MLHSSENKTCKENPIITDNLPLSIEIDKNLSCVYFQVSKQIKSKEKTQKAVELMLRKLYSEMVSLGIRPVFQLNSLRFLNPDNKQDNNQFVNTLKSIGNWSYALDIPVATCDVYFNNMYSASSVINIIMCGIIESNNRFINSKIKAGQEIIIVSPDLKNNSSSSPAYKDKLIMEAVLKCIKNDIVKSIWKINDNGLLKRLQQLSSNYNIGFKINYNKDFNYNDLEKSLSEIQNKQLLFINSKDLKSVEEIFEHYDIQTINLGQVIKDKKTIAEDSKKKLHEFELPEFENTNNAEQLTVKKRAKKTSAITKNINFNIEDLKENTDYKISAFKLLNSLNICSKSWLYKQFDAMSGIPEIFSVAESDATIINLNKESTSFLVAIGGTAQYSKHSINDSVIIATADAARKVICSGGIPSALTYSQGFDNYSEAENFEEILNNLSQSLGLTAIKINNNHCHFIDAKSKLSQIFEPTICVTGLLPEKDKLLTMSFKHKGDLIYLIGEAKNDISSSQYLINEYGIDDSPMPYFDYISEALLYESITELNRKKILSSAHSVSKGGLFTALAESSFTNKLGFDITTDCEIRNDAFLFGESQGRALVSVNSDNETEFIDYLVSVGIHFTLLGHVTKGSFRVNDEDFGDVDKAYKFYSKAMENKFNQVI